MIAAGTATVRVGLLGAGRIGRLHGELLARRVPDAEVAAVFDTDGPLAEELAQQLGAAAAASVEELLAADLDAVAICSSSDTHVELILAATEAGKAIFCEKPVSLELGEVDRALAAVRRAGVPFQIGFNRRFDPGHESVRRAVVEGQVGTPQLVRISSRDPQPPPLRYVERSGGLFLDMTIHDFDMARFVTGSEVEEVYASGTVRIVPEYATAGDVDTAVVTLVHADGCLTVIDNSRSAAYGYDQRVEVFGSEGMAVSENPPIHHGVLVTADGSLRARLPGSFTDRYATSYEREWRAFIDALRDGVAPPLSPEDARAPLVIGLAARRSVRERRPVRIDEVSGS